MSFYDDDEIPEGKAEIVKPKGFDAWLIKHDSWRGRGRYLCRDGFWRDFDALANCWNQARYASKDEAELALAQMSLMEAATPGSSWKAPPLNDAPRDELTPKQSSQLWLLAFCDRYAADYDDLVKSALKGEGYCFGEDDGPGAARGEDFWEHLRTATGQEPANREETYFHCAC